MDVGNLAGEKEELNNQLKDKQQRECGCFARSLKSETLPQSELLMVYLFPLMCAELQRTKEAEKQMVSVKVSFEKQLQNERTLKIQVCLSAHTQLGNTLSESRFLLANVASSLFTLSGWRLPSTSGRQENKTQ